jgi:hypothetical protein
MTLFLTITFKLAHLPAIATKVTIVVDSKSLIYNTCESDIHGLVNDPLLSWTPGITRVSVIYNTCECDI